MSKVERYRAVLGLGLPIVGGMISQNVLNLVDTAMVGSLGDDALAGVGTGSFLNFMAIAFVMGFASGVQAMVSRRVGEGREAESAIPLNGALLLIVIFTIPWAALLYQLVPTFFPLVNDSSAVVDVGVPYLQARLCGIVAVAMNFSFRGFWNGIKRPMLYLYTLVVMHAVNIGLNYVLIFGKFGAPELGATGAGVASAVSVWVGFATYMLLGLRHAKDRGFLSGLPDKKTIRTMLRLSVPTGVQQLLFSGGYTMLFWILGQVGTAATAAANVIINVMLVAILPGIAFGIAGATLVGQALGRKDPDDAMKWGWDVVTVAVAFVGCLGLPMALLPDLILGIFIHDPETLALGRVPLMIFGGTIILDAVGLVLMNALLGAGASRTTALVSTGCQWLLFLPAAYVVGPYLGYGLIGIWIAQAVYRAVQAGIFAALWKGGRWAAVEV
ncbi:MAG: MATE family efflux transporter [Deltaproteobacteria bacterium]